MITRVRSSIYYSFRSNYNPEICFEKTTIILFSVVRSYNIGIIELFAHCKGGNFNIHIWTWFGFIISLKGEIRFYLFGKELIGCLSRAKMRAFHENPNRIHTELTFVNAESAYHKKSYVFVIR